MGDETVLVRFSGVQKTYDGEVLVVRDLDLDIRAGEFLTLLGPSGSGKTTTLMMLAGFEAPTAGDILLAGRSIKNMPPHRRDIGVVFQNYALFPHMTVAENIAFPLSVRGVSKAETAARVARALETVRLPGYGDRRPSQLSGGQQQRVALARALVFEPQIVLMDEPLGALDKQLREHMQIEIKHLHRQLGLTVVYVTHDQSEALTMSDRVAVFNDGAIEQVDAPGVLYEQPCNSFVANFIGENNVIHGMVEALDGPLCRVRLGCGTGVWARAANIAGVGAPTSLSLRPERVMLGGADGVGWSRLAGRVTETIYLGDHVRLIVRTDGADDLMIKTPITTNSPLPRSGERVTVSFRAEDCRALDPVQTSETVGSNEDDSSQTRRLAS